jgi:putative FmdB family regulatory protein
MPIYEYECPTHGRYEVNQRITEDALQTCNKSDCHQPVRKLISSTSFALKGGGWYSDGYGSTGTSGGGGKSEAAGAGACGAPACATGCASTKAEA